MTQLEGRATKIYNYVWGVWEDKAEKKLKKKKRSLATVVSPGANPWEK